MIAWQLAGTILCALGVGTLYLAWRKKRRDWLFVATGWALLLIGILLWAQTGGVDKGPALGIVTVMFVGLLAVGIHAVATPIKKNRRTVQRGDPPTGEVQVAFRRYGVALNAIAIVLAGLAVSVVVCTAVFMGNRAVGLEHTSNLTLTMFAFPILWAAIATFIGYSSSTNLRVTSLLGFTAVAVLILLLSMGAA